MGTKFRLLHEYPLFRGLNEEQLQAVMQVSREECFLPNTILFEEGLPALEIFVLVKGEVEESFTVDDAKITLLRSVEKGEIIGCPALTPPHIHRCTARSSGKIEVLAIDAIGLRELFARECQIARIIQHNVIEALVERLRKMRLAPQLAWQRIE